MYLSSCFFGAKLTYTGKSPIVTFQGNSELLYRINRHSYITGAEAIEMMSEEPQQLK